MTALMHLFLSTFWRNAARHRRILWMLIPTVALLYTMFVVEALYGRYAIDRMVEATQGKDVPWITLFAVWIGIYLLMNFFQSINMYLRWTLQGYLLAESRQYYYDRVLHLDINHHVRAKAGEMMKTIDNASDSIVDLTREFLLELLPSFIGAIAFYVIGFFISPALALITVILIPVYIVIIVAMVWWSQKHINKVNALWVKSLGRGYDAMANIFTVKSSGAEVRELKRMESIHEEGLRELRHPNLIWAILEGIGYFSLMRIAVIGAGMYLLVHGDLTLGSLFFFQFTFFRMVVPMEMLGHILPMWNEKIGKVRLAETLSNTEVRVQNSAHPIVPEQCLGAIVFQNVSFQYGEEETLKHVHLDVKPGEHIAFVGHSGAGKSTMALLLNRFYDVSSGRILVDGTDLRDLDLSWWRRSIGLVLQENILFNDTVLENIRYSRPDATMEEVIDAAKRASAAAFIEQLPNGYDTMIGERGIRLSGGERQRIAIARAILKRPSIVVLDEATSALDSITEQSVQKGIHALMEGRTSFIIAHRLSTVRTVDRIAIMEEGRITACAPHEQLLKESNVYRQMVELQHEGLLAE